MSKCTAVLLLVQLFIYLFPIGPYYRKEEMRQYYLELLFCIRIPTDIRAIFVESLHSENINPDF